MVLQNCIVNVLDYTGPKNTRGSGSSTDLSFSADLFFRGYLPRNPTWSIIFDRPFRVGSAERSFNFLADSKRSVNFLTDPKRSHPRSHKVDQKLTDSKRSVTNWLNRKRKSKIDHSRKVGLFFGRSLKVSKKTDRPLKISQKIDRLRKVD